MAQRASKGSPAKNMNKGYGQEVKSPMAMMKSKKPSTAFAMKMSETKSALPMNMPDSPMKKALIGNQDKLPQALQDDIKAAPDSPAKKVAPRKREEAKSVDQLGAAQGSNSKSKAGDFTSYGSKNTTLANDNDIKSKTVIKKATTQVKRSKGETKRSAKKAVRQGKRSTAKSERVAKKVKRLENRKERVSLKGKQATEAGKVGANSRARDLVAKKARLQKRIDNKKNK